MKKNGSVQADRSTVDIAVHLLGRRTTDVTAVALYGVDAMSHLAWHFMDPESFPDQRIDSESLELFGDLIPAYYEYVDSLARKQVDTTQIRIFKTYTGGAAAYSVFFGEYASRKAALKAKKDLPEVLRKTSPIPLSVGGIRQEIRRLEAES